jgi:ATP-dependent Clp protease adaptor protein ClpS
MPMRNVSGFKRGVEINTSGLYVHRMRLNAEPTVMPLVDPETDQRTQEVTDPGYLVICWDDPVNLMDYVTHVFQKVFGWERAKADKHMLEVHENGKSMLVRESMEMAEHYVHQLHRYNLHATMERSE